MWMGLIGGIARRLVGTLVAEVRQVVSDSLCWQVQAQHWIL